LGAVDFKFKVLGVKRRLSPIKKTLNPSWGPEVSLRIPISAFSYKHGVGSDESTDLKVEVWDWDRGSKDDFMGAITIPLSTLLARKDNADETRELLIVSQSLQARSKSDRVGGSVSFKIAFVPYQ
jgi:Ca2+-dependent lipid-binding protein